MKNIRHIAFASVLGLALSATAFAGDITVHRTGDITVHKAGDITVHKAGDITVHKRLMGKIDFDSIVDAALMLIGIL
ncbi:MAG TPA: hypothetical protein VN920_16500 [Pyrinomonadaceae bacterium]|nr:hypothetical protein [Pyrinomonadaceae bacterium]